MPQKRLAKRMNRAFGPQLAERRSVNSLAISIVLQKPAREKDVSVIRGERIGVGGAKLRPVTGVQDVGMIEPPKFVPCMGLIQKLGVHACQSFEPTAEVQSFVELHVIERFSPGGRAPRVGRAADHTGNSDRPRYPERLSFLMSLKDNQQLAQPPANAGLLHKPPGRFGEFGPQRFVQRLPLACYGVAPVDILDDLLRAEGDE